MAKTKERKTRVNYLCTSITCAIGSKESIKPLTIPANDELLEYMAKKLRTQKVEQLPLRTNNLGIKFSLDKEPLFIEVKKRLKELNIRLSNFYKECYDEFLALKKKEAKAKGNIEIIEKLITQH